MTNFTQADIDAAEKRGREAAWDEGVRVALNYAIRNRDGVTLRLEKTNPYRTSKETTP